MNSGFLYQYYRYPVETDSVIVYYVKRMNIQCGLNIAKSEVNIAGRLNEERRIR